MYRAFHPADFDWEAVDLGNGLFGLRAPDHMIEDGQVRLTNGDNYCDRYTDPKTAGVAIVILALNRLLWSEYAHERDDNCASVSQLWENVQDRS